MKYLGPTRYPKLNGVVGVVFLYAGLFAFFSLVSYHPFDPSLNTASAPSQPVNLTGLVGAYLSDFLLQLLGLDAYAIPVLVLILGWMWIRSAAIESPLIKIFGALLLVSSLCTALGMISAWRPIADRIPAGGLAGSILADALVGAMNITGASLTALACSIVSLYLISTFEVQHLVRWFDPPFRALAALGRRFSAWREERIRRARMRAQARALKKSLDAEKAARLVKAGDGNEAALSTEKAAAATKDAEPPARAARPVAPPPEIDDIPIHILETPPFEITPPFAPLPVATASSSMTATAARRAREVPRRQASGPETPGKARFQFQIPPTGILQEPAQRSAYDSYELKEIAVQIKSKFQEFNVLGSVTQINPGPVVTTFEFKPEAGVKYSRITTLSEDLCLGLQAESILIERIPGKPTVGIEVPNSKREVISLRQILESEEFNASPSPLTVALGKDISGRIKVAALDSMPHLLIAGSTGSGKSVMLNSLIMSILYKATPHQVRMIMVDPKRLEFGPYEGIPHLLTPVITDAKKATIALRNAVLEMERRLKLLASQGVRNIEQYNRKIRLLQDQPRSLFEEEEAVEEPLEPIPYIVIIIDELADLMMLERANVEESVTRLAQMARAVGMHLVLATQRPSVDVITGLIKANFPSRISFRVATRVDSRTVLDVMGAEHLLGKGDMLFLPPGSSRLVRVHGSYVSEAETNDVVEFWKRQAAPEYDQTFLIPPPSADDEEAEDFEGPEDAMYQEAVRVVCEMGKASTSTLQRRLRLGYGRAARILDMMQRDGIIGPPDGSRPRDVLKRPDWLEEIENQVK
jgi:DNA segregation ATPase FtsK/SpoIIIE, S-DNA-T family